MLHRTLICAVCTVGLVACSQQDSQPPSDPDNLTLKLNRLNDGSMEYCDAAGDCQSLPYDGECAIIEVSIDPDTGATCETCIMDDGTTIDLGCTGTVVGCVLVTLPEPDCLVCAYYNGAVIFSTCTVDEPECVTDMDCCSHGRIGFCVDGMCVYDDGCRDDGDCPPGFRCVWPADAAGSNTDAWLGACVPAEIPCLTDAECPPDMVCEISCWDYGSGSECNSDADCPDGLACIENRCLPDCAYGDPTCVPPPPPCKGVCVDRPHDPCEGVSCGEGEHCELACYLEGNYDIPCPPDNPFCGCEPICVPDPDVCHSNDDCDEGEICQMWCHDVPVDCGPDQDCMPYPCEGVCVPYIPHPCDEVTCGEGEHCELECRYDPTIPCSSDDPFCGCKPVCVPDPKVCHSNDDCAEGEICQMWCYDRFGAPCFDEDGDGVIDCPPPYCEGICVPYVPSPCDEVVCDDGQHCELQCLLDGQKAGDIACIPEDPFCGCVPVCVDDPQSCWSDADCDPDEVCQMWCSAMPVECGDVDGDGVPECPDPRCEGICVPYYPDPCDGYVCPDGEQCQVQCDYALPCDTSTDPYCGCDPVCVPEPRWCYSDEDCPAGQVCDFVEPPCDSATGCDPGQGISAPGVCVDAGECATDDDCPPGHVCEFVDCAPGGPDCRHRGICMPADPVCLTDDDCLDSAGNAGTCVDGICK